MSVTLNQILDLVGKLDDAAGDDNPRERFRRFLRENIREVGQIRDYVEECLRDSGDQYNRALQDLVNHLGHFLDFKVTFGRYHGVQGQLGFDGFWESPTGFHIVVEVKTTQVYAIKKTTLVGYVDSLISESMIPSWDNALGLYIVGRPDPEIRQLENAIIAEKRTNQLRVISVESLLSLAEMMNEYDVNHEDVLSVLRPSGPVIDPVVDLMARLVAQRGAEELPQQEIVPAQPARVSEVVCWLTPVKSDEEQTAEEVIETIVGKERIYAFGERTPGRRHLKQGDCICFCATTKGVVARAEVLTKPERKTHPAVRHPEEYPWVFSLKNSLLYLNKPVVIDASVRSQLDAFVNRDASRSWAWFVQATRKITKHDFDILTRQQ
jgi:hypothetical protein